MSMLPPLVLAVLADVFKFRIAPYSNIPVHQSRLLQLAGRGGVNLNIDVLRRRTEASEIIDVVPVKEPVKTK
jgi:hypothetical protein